MKPENDPNPKETPCPSILARRSRRLKPNPDTPRPSLPESRTSRAITPGRSSRTLRDSKAEAEDGTAKIEAGVE